jgi:hypothetical protein
MSALGKVKMSAFENGVVLNFETRRTDIDEQQGVNSSKGYPTCFG